MSASERVPDDLALEIHRLAHASLEGTASDEEVARLDHIICTNPAAGRYLAHAVQTSQHLREWAASRPAGSGATEPLSLRSPALGFLGGILRVRGGSSLVAAMLWPIVLLCTGVVAGMLVMLALPLRSGNDRVRRPGTGGEQTADGIRSMPHASAPNESPSSLPSVSEKAAPQFPGLDPRPGIGPVAWLNHTSDCRWPDRRSAPRPAMASCPARSCTLNPAWWKSSSFPGPGSSCKDRRGWTSIPSMGQACRAES